MANQTHASWSTDGRAPPLGAIQAPSTAFEAHYLHQTPPSSLTQPESRQYFPKRAPLHAQYHSSQQQQQLTSKTATTALEWSSTTSKPSEYVEKQQKHHCDQEYPRQLQQRRLIPYQHYVEQQKQNQYPHQAYSQHMDGEDSNGGITQSVRTTTYPCTQQRRHQTLLTMPQLGPSVKSSITYLPPMDQQQHQAMDRSIELPTGMMDVNAVLNLSSSVSRAYPSNWLTNEPHSQQDQASNYQSNGNAGPFGRTLWSNEQHASSATSVVTSTFDSAHQEVVESSPYQAYTNSHQLSPHVTAGLSPQQSSTHQVENGYLSRTQPSIDSRSLMSFPSLSSTNSPVYHQQPQCNVDLNDQKQPRWRIEQESTPSVQSAPLTPSDKLAERNTALMCASESCVSKEFLNPLRRPLAANKYAPSGYLEQTFCQQQTKMNIPPSKSVIVPGSSLTVSSGKRTTLGGITSILSAADIMSSLQTPARLEILPKPATKTSRAKRKRSNPISAGIAAHPLHQAMQYKKPSLHSRHSISNGSVSSSAGVKPKRARRQRRNGRTAPKQQEIVVGKQRSDNSATHPSRPVAPVFQTIQTRDVIEHNIISHTLKQRSDAVKNSIGDSSHAQSSDTNDTSVVNARPQAPITMSSLLNPATSQWSSHKQNSIKDVERRIQKQAAELITVQTRLPFLDTNNQAWTQGTTLNSVADTRSGMIATEENKSQVTEDINQKESLLAMSNCQTSSIISVANTAYMNEAALDGSGLPPLPSALRTESGSADNAQLTKATAELQLNDVIPMQSSNNTVIIFCKRDFMRYQATKLWKKYQDKLKRSEFKCIREKGKRTRYLNPKYATQFLLDQAQRTGSKRRKSARIDQRTSTVMNMNASIIVADDNGEPSSFMDFESVTNHVPAERTGKWSSRIAESEPRSSSASFLVSTNNARSTNSNPTLNLEIHCTPPNSVHPSETYTSDVISNETGDDAKQSQAIHEEHEREDVTSPFVQSESTSATIRETVISPDGDGMRSGATSNSADSIETGDDSAISSM